MENYKYLIIGGGAAGTSAAETIRAKDSEGTVAIVSDEIHPLYSRVMLSKPNFFLGKIPFEQIWMKGLDWYDKNKISFLGGQMADELDAKKKILKLSDGRQIGYEKLLIATGVRTRAWNISGSDKAGIYSLRTLEDGKAIMEVIKTAKKAVTIGGGFIGFEMADLMKLAGLETTMILREDYFWQPTLDETSGKMIENALSKNGIKILKNTEVTEVVGGENVSGVVLKDGTKFDCDIIITGIGVVPPSLDWLQKAGVNTGRTISAVGQMENGIKSKSPLPEGNVMSAAGRSILADEFLETNVADVWTAGDIAEYKDLLLEENIQLGNWVNAREQGRVAGLNMVASANVAGAEKTPFKFVSFYTTQGAGINIAFVGDVRPLPDRVVVKRGSPEINSYCRILVDNKNELVGATMINRTAEMSTISKLIENNVNVSAHLAELADVNFDLKKLLM
jgi:NAD(P)H-nitrite reductase large subunit